MKDLRPGHEIHLADGTVTLVAEKPEYGGVRCRVRVGGVVRSGSGLNLLDTEFSGAVPTTADRKWIRFARRHRVDWLAISFVQTPGEIEAVRRLAGKDGPRLIAKIEKRGALRRLEDIVEAADGVMVARGDLGVETPLAEVPIVQKRIIALANSYGRPVITATQMLESMVENAAPTRAEVADVANAILDGTDAVMLSAESAIGKFPVQAAATLARVAAATEKSFPFSVFSQRFADRSWASFADAISFSAVRLARDSAAHAILVSPSAATSAGAIARFRPEAPVILLSSRWEDACRQTLSWGVDPLVVPRSWNRLLPLLRRKLRRIHEAKRGNHVVMVQPCAGLGGAGSDILRIVPLQR